MVPARIIDIDRQSPWTCRSPITDVKSHSVAECCKQPRTSLPLPPAPACTSFRVLVRRGALLIFAHSAVTSTGRLGLSSVEIGSIANYPTGLFPWNDRLHSLKSLGFKMIFFCRATILTLCSCTNKISVRCRPLSRNIAITAQASRCNSL